MNILIAAATAAALTALPPSIAPDDIQPGAYAIDTKETLVTTLSHGALTTSGGADPLASTVTTSRAALESVILGQKTLAAAIGDGSVKIAGDARPLRNFWALLVDFQTAIPLIAPR